MRRKAFKNHMLQKKTTARKRKLSHIAQAHERDEENIRLMLPYL